MNRCAYYQGAAYSMESFPDQLSFYAPPGLEQELGCAGLSDVKIFQGEGSPMKIQLDSLSFQGFGKEKPQPKKSPFGPRSPEALASAFGVDAPKPRSRLQNAAYATSKASSKSSVPVPLKAKSSMVHTSPPPGTFHSPPPGVFQYFHVQVPKADATKRSQPRERDMQTEQPKRASVGKHSSGVPPTLLARLSAGSPEVSLYEVLSCLSAVARDEVGSKFLKARLPDASKEIQAMLIGAALLEIVETSMHEFGHTFIVQLLEVSTSEQNKVIAEKLASHVMQLSLDPYGCRVMQKALQVMSGDCREQVVEGLKEGSIECMKSRHGNHVIQVCIEEMPSASAAFILDAVETWGAEAASTHICTCRVVMRLLEHMPRQKLHGLLQQICQCAAKLAQNRYGNYVLQHILEHGDVADKRAVISELLKSDMLELATQKYGHSVVEKCIQIAFSPESEVSLEAERIALSDTLLKQEKEGVSAFVKLSSDRYGAKIVQSLMDYVQESPLGGVDAGVCAQSTA